MIVFRRERVLWTYLVVLVLLLQFTMRASCRLDVVNQRTVLESENENIILLKPSDEGNDSIKLSKERGAPNFEGDIVVSTSCHILCSSQDLFLYFFKEFKDDEKRLNFEGDLFDLAPTSFLPTKLIEEVIFSLS